MDTLFEAGILGVVFCPIQMKTNRLGIIVQVMGCPQYLDSLQNILLRESTILGVRFRYSQRKILKGILVEIEGPWGKMAAKKILSGGAGFLVPEYEECRRIARKENIPLKEIYNWVTLSGRET